MYKDLLNNEEIKQDIRKSVKDELDKLEIIDKINYIEKIEKELPDIFSGMKDDKLIKELKDFIINQKFKEKSILIWKFFKSWPDLFKDIEDDPRIDQETNQLMLLFKIKGALNDGEVNELQNFIHEMGEKYGRKNILEKGASIKISYEGYSEENNLFNKKDLEQLKFSLYKETRTEEELERDEHFDVYAFIGYDDFKEIEIEGESFHKKQIGIENLVKINKYNSASLSQVSMMKIRAVSQGETRVVWGVYIPKYMWDKDYAYNTEIPDNIRKYIDEHKFKF